ncbi:MAG: UvrB/UvrC motif-containing protein, partial [Oscillospiraceae bacterium]
HDITPTTIKKDVREILEISKKDNYDIKDIKSRRMAKGEKDALIKKLTIEMKAAAKLLEFEHAAFLRDKIEKINEL